MNYLSTKEIAKKWGVDTSLVLRLARNGRIEGAVLFGNNWMFPHDATKPADARRKSSDKSSQQEGFFRFPVYLNHDESSYYPPLSEEERLLRQAQIDFQAFRINEAKIILLPLSQNATNRYVRLAALYHCCTIAQYENSSDYAALLLSWNIALSEDFPHKREMLLFKYAFDMDKGSYASLFNDFIIEPEYSYHPSAYDMLFILSIVPIVNGDFSLVSKLRFDSYELMCQDMEHNGRYLAAQKLHYMLLIVYQLQHNEERMVFHVRRALQIAYEYELYWSAVYYKHYYPDVCNKVLADFPPGFIHIISSLCETLNKHIKDFAFSHNNPSFLELLSEKDFELAFLANQGYSNKDISKMLNISEKVISKRYNKIYEKLGIQTKKELVELINSTHKQ